MYVCFGGLALLIALVLGASPVLADDEFTRKGFYAGVGGVFAIEEFGDGADEPYGGGFDLTLGYRVGPVVSLETEFEWVGHWFRNEDTVDQIRISMWTWSANLKGNVPLGWIKPDSALARIQPYGTVGFGFYRVIYERFVEIAPGSSDDIDAMMMVAAGIDFYVTKNVVLSPEYSYNFLFNGTESLDYMGVSGKITYRF
jgi:opacity protein-like surface antigen